MRRFFAKLFGFASRLCLVAGSFLFIGRFIITIVRRTFDPNPTWMIVAFGLFLAALLFYIGEEELRRRSVPWHHSPTWAFVTKFNCHNATGRAFPSLEHQSDRALVQVQTLLQTDTTIINITIEYTYLLTFSICYEILHHSSPTPNMRGCWRIK